MDPSRHPLRRRRGLRLTYKASLSVAALAILCLALLLTISPEPFIRPALEELEAEAGLHVRYATAHFRPHGLVLTDVDLKALERKPSTGTLPMARIDRIVLRPSLLGLLTGRRGLPCTATADLYDGSANVLVAGNPEEWTAIVEWSEIDVQHFHRWWDQPEIMGLSSGRISLSGRGVDAEAAVDGSWDISGRQVVADGLKTGNLVLPRISTSTLHTTGSWTGRYVTVSDFEADGSLGRIHLSGKIVLRQPIEKSGLRMQLTHESPSHTPAEFEFLLHMLLPPGASAGAKAYHVRGTLALPALTPVRAS